MKDAYMDKHRQLFAIFCYGCAGSGAWAVTREIAVEAWNRRAKGGES